MRPARIDLYWLPLGAGGRSVRWNGRVFEAVAARAQGRPARDLYHSALLVRSGDDHFVVEQAPAWGNGRLDRGVVGEGAVGLGWLGRSALFRYEVRLWRHGVIPDIAEAVGGPRRVATDVTRTARLLDLVRRCPTPTWGRDELHAGEMWNSNSVVSWLLCRSGHDTDAISMPPGGRAPGWSAGLVVARRAANLPTGGG